MKQPSEKGIWLLCTENLSFTWIGDSTAPVPTLREKMRFAEIYMRSNGYGSTLKERILKLAKAIAFCLKSAHVCLSGNEIPITGLSAAGIVEEWASFNSTRWMPPQAGHGKDDIADARESNCF